MKVMSRPSAVVALAMASIALLAPSAAFAASSVATATAKSLNPVVTNEVWVSFGRAGYMSAAVSGTASGVATGAVADLYAVTYPFKTAMTSIASDPLSVTGGSAPFAFRVTPQLETRYRVEIFATSSSTTPKATSAPVVVFLSGWFATSNTEGCSKTSCTIHISLTEIIPASAIPTEKAKHQFLYLDIVRWSGGSAPNPTTYRLVSGRVSAPTVSGDHVHFKISITYRRPSYQWWWYWQSCTKDTVAKDGYGLAGPHGCGARTVSPHAKYLG